MQQQQPLQGPLQRRLPILSAKQIAVAAIFGGITFVLELLRVTIPGYLPGVNFSLTGIWLTLGTMIGGPIVGLIIVFLDSVSGQVGLIGFPGFAIHVLILAALYKQVYAISNRIVRAVVFVVLSGVALFFQYWWWIALYSFVLKIIPFKQQVIYQFTYPYWVYLAIYALIPVIILLSAPRFVAPEWSWPWLHRGQPEAEAKPQQA
jgi:riboflavin transporter FmnP